MRSLFLLVVLLSASCSLADDRPNVVVILADDLGFSDLGCYGSDIQTPHLDELARNGLRFSQFYNTARCWPTRASLLTGYYPQQVGRDALPDRKEGGGSRSKRPEWAELVPAMLRSSGYRSYHSGKWHVDGMPVSNGFHRSYIMRDHNRFFSPRVHFSDDKKLPPVPRGTDFYVSDAIADHAIECLTDHQAQHPDKPFFHFVAFTAPHFPLHAPAEDVARYRERYLCGWEDVRDERWTRQRKMGLLKISLSAVERELGPPYDFPDHLKILGDGEVNRPLPWSELTGQQRRFQADKMAVHAAMVDRMDQQIGRIVSQVRSMGVLDNTLILFLSDNGASAEIMVRGDGHDPRAAPGSAESYLCLGPGWSTTCNTPFRRHKTWVHEGGISTPLIAHWPAGFSAKNEFRQAVGHVIDIVPTILDLAQATPAGDGGPEFPGASLVPILQDASSCGHDSVWWCHEGHRAFRQGHWKLVAAKGDPWELYDLSNDRGEQKNLAAVDPDRVRQLDDAWTRMADSFRRDMRRRTK